MTAPIKQPLAAATAITAHTSDEQGLPSRLEAWCRQAQPGELRAEAARRIEAAKHTLATRLDLRNLGLRSMPFPPHDLPMVSELLITGNPGLVDLDHDWAPSIAMPGLFLSELDAFETLARWADALRSRRTRSELLSGLLANMNLGHRLLAGEAPTALFPDPRREATRRFCNALEIGIKVSQNTAEPAQSLLRILPPDEAFVNAAGLVIHRSDIEGLARRELPVTAATLRERAAHSAAMEETHQQITAGWGANVHLNGLISRGALILTQIRARHRRPPPDLAETCDQIRGAFSADPHALAGLDWALGEITPIHEGHFKTDFAEVVRHMWAYCQSQLEPEMLDMLTHAFGQRLRDIANDQPCPTGSVQRLLHTPDGIDLKLLAGIPDVESLQREISTRVAQLDAHLDARLDERQKPPPRAARVGAGAELTDHPDHTRAEAALRFKLHTACDAIHHSLIVLHGLPAHLVRVAARKPLDDLEANELMMADMTIADLSPNYRDAFGLSALQKSVIRDEPAAIRALMAQGADVNQTARFPTDQGHEPPLVWAAREGRMNALEALLESSHINADAVGEADFTALMSACANGHLGVAERLLASGKTDPNTANQSGRTALLLAVRGGHLEVVKALLCRPGIDPNKARNSGTTALMIAARQGHVDIARLLLEHPQINANQTDRVGMSALAFAAREGHTPIVGMLLARADVDPNLIDHKNGASALVYAAMRGHTDAVRALLQSPTINTSIKEKNHGFTALMMTVSGNHPDTLKALLESDRIDPKIRDRSGATARRIARELKHKHLVGILSEHPAYRTQPGRLGIGSLIKLANAITRLKE